MIYKRYKDLDFVCPECDNQLVLWKHWDFESALTGTVPYYCKHCDEKQGMNHIIINVTTRKNEFIFIGSFLIAGLLLVVWIIYKLEGYG